MTHLSRTDREPSRRRSINSQFTLAFAPMLAGFPGWLSRRPAVKHLTIEELHREYAALPPVSECDRSRRVQILERLVEELKRENDMLRRSKASEGGLLPSRTVSRGYSERPVPCPIAFAVKGSLLTHVDTLKDAVSTQCPGAQWLASYEYPNGGDITATARVLFFRTNQRVSPTELEELKTFCASPTILWRFCTMRCANRKKTWTLSRDTLRRRSPALSTRQRAPPSPSGRRSCTR